MINEKIQTLAQEFVDGTTFHGVKQTVTASGTLRKTLWILFMIGSLTGVTVEIYEILNAFMRSPVAINIQFEKLDQVPPITLCPNRWINKTKLDQTGFDNETIEYLRGFRLDEQIL